MMKKKKVNEMLKDDIKAQFMFENLIAPKWENTN